MTQPPIISHPTLKEWYEPFSFSEILKRTFSLLNLAIFLFTASLIFSEFRFDWFENYVGNYLVSTNESRPETGAIWEAGKQSSNAHASLNKIISKKEASREHVLQASSFPGLAAGILPGEWVTLERQQFKSLYLGLERPMALKIIEPAQLIRLLNGNALDRIFCEGVAHGLRIYFIDSDNRVIRQIDLKEQDLVEIETGEQPVPGRLDDMEGFQGRIYPVDQFFEALFKLPPDIIPDLMVDPQALLKQEGKITHVGIWNEARNGYIRIGFEFDAPGRHEVVFMKAREWAVWQLSLNMKGAQN